MLITRKLSDPHLLMTSGTVKKYMYIRKKDPDIHTVHRRKKLICEMYLTFACLFCAVYTELLTNLMHRIHEMNSLTV
jgi:hypothetical protein